MASEAARAAKARYRERNREKIRATGRIYAERKRRESGMPQVGSPESTHNRSTARKLRGADHPNWRGDDVGYFALHAWVARHKQRHGSCEWCGEVRRTTFANLSRTYRRSLDDFAELCYPCHKKFDLARLKGR